MTELGRIFDEDRDDERPRGRNLHHHLTFPRYGLGKPTPVQVPLELPLDGQRVRRALGPGDTDATVVLSLPTTLPSGPMPDEVVLCMRGLGEEIDDGPPGDLFLHLKITAVAAPGKPIGGWLLAVLVLGGALAGLLLFGR